MRRWYSRPGAAELIPTGISIYIADPGLAAVLLPRSGLGPQERHRARQSGGPDRLRLSGTADGVGWNRGAAPFTINPGDRIAQMVFVPVVQVGFEVVEDFSSHRARRRRLRQFGARLGRPRVGAPPIVSRSPAKCG